MAKKTAPAKTAKAAPKGKAAPAKAAPKGKAPAKGDLKMTPSQKLADAKAAGRDAWNASRTRAPRRGGLPFIPDGTYVLRVVGAKLDVYSKGANEGTMYLSIKHKIAFAEPVLDEDQNEIVLIGKSITTKDDFSGDEIPGFDTPTTRMDLLSERLQLMGMDISEMEMDEIEELVASLNNDQPFIKAKVSTKEKKGTGANAGKTYTNRYVNVIGPLTDEEYNELVEQYGDEGIPESDEAAESEDAEE